MDWAPACKPKETKKTILLISKRIKHLGINLTKEGKVLYTENYKTELREIKGDKKLIKTRKIERRPVFMDWKT